MPCTSSAGDFDFGASVFCVRVLALINRDGVFWLFMVKSIGNFAESRITVMDFAERLIEWYGAGHRDLPWRRTREPYSIWVSEIMLQQTRAETVIPYYKRFLQLFPDVYALASADDQTLMKAWEGLGYYIRARNLKKAAQAIVLGGGDMPSSLEDLKRLPGIGDYTAAAICSIAYGYPVAAVDGNFERVFCRWNGISRVSGTLPARRRIAQEAEKLIPQKRAGDFSNAIMELGATVCLPKTPACDRCPIAHGCRAYREGSPEAYPVLPDKKKKRMEKHCLMLVYGPKGVLVYKREESLLNGLYAFPDCSGSPDVTGMCRWLEEKGIKAAYEKTLGHARHVFTHVIWDMDIHSFRLLDEAEPAWGEWADAAKLRALPMPTAVRAARRFAQIRTSSEEIFNLGVKGEN